MRLALVLPFVCLVSAPAATQAAPTLLALDGLDPVALCGGHRLPGDERRVLTHGIYRYRFANDENRDAFDADPERWAIQWDGACGRMGPLSGRGDSTRYHIHGGRIWVFASDACREAFQSAPQRFVPPMIELPEPTAEQLAQGREWIERALEAHGGAERIDRFRALRLGADQEMRGWSNTMELVVTRDCEVARRSSWTPPADAKDAQPLDTRWIAKADTVFMVDADGVSDLVSPASREDLIRLAHREPIVALWARNRPDFVATFVRDREAENRVDIRVEYAGLRTTLHLDRKKGTILAVSWRGRPAEGVTRDVHEKLTAWRSIQDVKAPVGRLVDADGQHLPSWSGGWARAELLVEVPDEAFARPGDDRR